MHAPRWARLLPRAVVVGTALAAVTGCYTYSPYGRYPANPGYYSSPPPGAYPQPGVFTQPGGVITQPPSNLGPGTTIPPDGGIPGGSIPGGSIPGGNSYPGSTYPGSSTPGTFAPPTYSPPTGGSNFGPTPINGGPGDSYRPPMNQPMPQPYERDSTRPRVQDVPPARSLDTPTTDTFGNDPPNFGTRPGDARFTTPTRSPKATIPRSTLPSSTPRSNPGRGTFESDEQPFGPGARRAIAPGGAVAAASAGGLTPMANGPQLQPIGAPATGQPASMIPVNGPAAAPVIQAGAASGVTGMAAAVAAARAHHYDYDRDSYHWLRGTVDYDQEDGTWFLIYNLRPDEHDQYQGGMTLAAEPQQLSELKDGEAVLAEGEVDASVHDRRNAPVFRVTAFRPLPPR